MKRILSMVLTVAMLISVFLTVLTSGTVHAAPNDSKNIITIQSNVSNSSTSISQSDFTVEIPSKHEVIDDKVIIPIVFSNVPEKGIICCDMTIIYDPTQLEYISHDAGDIIINPDTNLSINKSYDGLIKLLFLDYMLKNEYITKDGIVAKLTFKKSNSYNESSSIKIIRSTFGDTDFTQVNTKIIQPDINIPIPTPPQTPTPTKTPTPTATPTKTPRKFFEATVGNVKGNTGDFVTVPVNFINVPANEISTAKIRLKYNSALLEFVSVSPGNIVPEADLNFNYSNSTEEFQGLINIDYTNNSEDTSYISKDGVFAYITFKILCTYDRHTGVIIDSDTFKDKNHIRVPCYIAPIGGVNISGIEPPPDFKVKLGSVQSYTNDLVTIPVIFSDVPAEHIHFFSFTLNYDPSQLEYVSYKPGKIFEECSPETCFEVYEESEGKLSFLYFVYTLEGHIERDGLLTNLTFKVKGSEGESELYITDPRIISRELKSVYTVTSPGTVSILPSTKGYTVSGYVYSELKNNSVSNFSFNEGFKVELSGTDFSALTDNNGYFEINDVPAGTYTLKITKANYLAREIKDFTIEKDEELSSPITLWIGDIEIDGKQDGAINMEDIMAICKAFNSVSGTARYKETLDLNKDNAINLEDVMIVVRHFNKTSKDY